MAKYRSAMWIEHSLARPVRRWPGRLLVAAVLITMAPLALDGVKVCYANWVAMTGGYAEIQTPAFDFARDTLREFRCQTGEVLGPILRSGSSWNSGTTIVFALGWALMLAWMFRFRR
jgi:hypothetical protein